MHASPISYVVSGCCRHVDVKLLFARRFATTSARWPSDGSFPVFLRRPVRELVALVTPEQPLELQILGRTLFHAALVGLGAGILGCAFFAGAELVQNLLLEQLAGYSPLRAQGEHVWGATAVSDMRWWLLAIIPALGALVGALIARYAPECRGGGG